jgi:Uma2 family endonuclease
MSTAMRFTVDEYDRMIEQGVFETRPECRLELVYGEVRETTPANPPHEDVVDLLDDWSHDRTDRTQVRVRTQNSIGISELDCVPLPDIAWVRRQSYRSARPTPADVLLIEVSETSLRYDRGEKAELYATAGITDYWIVNLKDNCIEVYRNPRDGEYREKRTYEIGQSVSPLAFPEIELPVADLFQQ